MSRLRHACYDRVLAIGPPPRELRQLLAQRCASIVSASENTGDGIDLRRTPRVDGAASGGTFGLVVIADALHALEPRDIDALAHMLSRCTEPGTEYLALHASKLHGPAGSSEDAVDTFIDSIGAHSVARRRSGGYRLDHWTVD
ncbi:hypothetical protein ACO2Q2_16400 [Dyella sp. KRB-257]|uniref:hypothetical protein n=1 Tax=Dyella sp. KRB-257 TaxID=3400915 RepID=UPI003BFEEA70